MFSASHPFLLFDYFRVPYHVEPSRANGAFGLIEAGGGGIVGWSRSDGESVLGFDKYELDGVPVPCRPATDAALAMLARTLPGRWRADVPLTNRGGLPVAHVWRDDRGSVLLPFDPGEAMQSFWSEQYGAGGAGSSGLGKRMAVRAYYRARPVLPRSVQLAMRRRYSRVQMRVRFPRWPVETGLHDLYERLFRWLAEASGNPVPVIASWPAPFTSALVLTHDVETEVGYRNVHLMREIERSAGLRSSWNFVPRRYPVADEVVAALGSDGFEVGVHGLFHDGRDIESRKTLDQRLPEIRRWAERWSAVGFRSPATHRSWELMPLLGFDYDSSSPDTDPFEPQPGGCCTWLPFVNDGLVVLPITLVQDHTLFEILGHASEEAWIEKAAFLRARGGLVLLITHPDYMLGDVRLEAYRRFVTEASGARGAWHALPRDAAAWWRRRQASSLVAGREGWRVEGPAAAEAAVELLGGS